MSSTPLSPNEWFAAYQALLDQINALEDECPCYCMPDGSIRSVTGDVCFEAPTNTDLYPSSGGTIVVYYARSMGGTRRSALLTRRDGRLEWHIAQSPLKWSLGWRNAVETAFAIRDERVKASQ